MTDRGFSLVEALVAMAVLAVAAGGMMHAAQAHIDTVAAVETRTVLGWAAVNRLAEARLGIAPGPSAILGHAVLVSVAARPSSDPGVTALTITATSGGVRVTLPGFRDEVAIAAAASTTAGVRNGTSPPDAEGRP